jgi:hypothetical protein
MKEAIHGQEETRHEEEGLEEGQEEGQEEVTLILRHAPFAST